MKKWLISGLSWKRFSLLRVQYLDQKIRCITNPIPAMEARHWNVNIATHLNLSTRWKCLVTVTSGRLAPGETIHGTDCIGGWLGPRGTFWRR